MADELLQRYRGPLGRLAREIQAARAEEAAQSARPQNAATANVQAGPSAGGEAARPGAGNPAHLSMRREVMDVLDRSDLDETQKQRILAGMTCPCCSGSGTSMILDIQTKADGPPDAA